MRFIYKGPDVVSLSCYLWNLDQIKQFIGPLKQGLQSIAVLFVGRGFGNVCQAEILMHMLLGFGYAARDEGEQTFCETVLNLMGVWVCLDDIKGLAHRSLNGIKKNVRGPAIQESKAISGFLPRT